MGNDYVRCLTHEGSFLATLGRKQRGADRTRATLVLYEDSSAPVRNVIVPRVDHTQSRPLVEKTAYGTQFYPH